MCWHQFDNFFLDLNLTNIQADYWWGEMHCGSLNQKFEWAMAHPAHAAVLPMVCLQ